LSGSRPAPSTICSCPPTRRSSWRFSTTTFCAAPYLPPVSPGWVTRPRRKRFQGQSLRLITAPTISINNGAALLQTDIRAGNNVIHAIDTVLIPPPTGSPL
jgi:hypothetical protein